MKDFWREIHDISGFPINIAWAAHIPYWTTHLVKRGDDYRMHLLPEVTNWLNENTFGGWISYPKSNHVDIGFTDERDPTLFKLFWHG